MLSISNASSPGIGAPSQTQVGNPAAADTLLLGELATVLPSGSIPLAQNDDDDSICYDEDDDDWDREPNYDRDVCNTRPIRPLSKYSGRYSQAATLPNSATRLVQLYDDLAALAPHSSQVVRQELHHISRVLTNAIESGLTRYIPALETHFARLLKFLRQVVLFEIQRGTRNDVATAKSLILSTIRAHTSQIEDLLKRHCRTLVTRCQTYVAVCTALQQAWSHLTSIVFEGNEYIGLANRHQRLADLVEGPSVLNGTLVGTIIAHEVEHIAQELEAMDLEDERPNIQQLLCLHPLLKGSTPAEVSFGSSRASKRSRSDILTAAAVPGSSVANSQSTTTSTSTDIDAADLEVLEDSGLTVQEHRIAILQHGEPSALEFDSEEEALEWKHRASALACPFMTHLQDGAFLDQPGRMRNLHAFVVALCQLHFWRSAAVLAHILAVATREAFDLDPTSTTLRKQLCFTLATFSLLCGLDGRGAEAVHAAREAVALFAPIFAQDPTLHALTMAQLKTQVVESLSMLVDASVADERKPAIQECINLYGEALAADRSAWMAKFGLAYVLQMVDTGEGLPGLGDTQQAMVSINLYLSAIKPRLFTLQTAHVLAEAMRFDKAKAFDIAHRAITIYEELIPSWPDQAHAGLVQVYAQLAVMHEATMDVHQALRFAQNGLQSYDRLDAQSRDRPRARRTWLDTLRAIVVSSLVTLERYREARTCLDLWRRQGDLRGSRPYAVTLRHHDAFTHFMVGDAARARTAIMAMMAFLDTRCKEDAWADDDDEEVDPRYDDDYVMCIGELGATFCVLGDVDGALANGAEAVCLVERFIYSTEQKRLYKERKGRLLVYYVATLIKAGRLEDALAHVDLALHTLPDHITTGSVRKTALLLKARVMRELGQHEREAALQMEAMVYPYHGFFDRLGCA